MVNLDSLQYLKKHAANDIILRGKKLFSSGAIKSKEFNKNTEIWSFSIQGTKLYKVNIFGDKDNVVGTSCTCPYDWGGICKHTVAALLSLNTVENVKQATLAIGEEYLPSKLRKKGEAFEIKEYKHISLGYISKNYKNTSEFVYFNTEIYSARVDFKDNILIFYFVTYNRNVQIQITYSNNKCLINSNQTKTLKNWLLDKYEAYVLFLIANSKMPNILEVIFDDKFETIKRQESEKYGLNWTKFDEYFEMKLSFSEGISTELRTEYKGLIPIREKSFQKPAELDIFSPQKNTDIVLNNVKENREIGFVFSLQYNKIIVKTIIGKPDKKQTKLSTHLEEYDSIESDKYNISLSENQFELIELIEKLELEDYNIQKQIIQKLSKEKYTYFLDANYGLKRKDLLPIDFAENHVRVVFKIFEDNQFITAEPFFRLDDYDYLLHEDDIKDEIKAGIFITNNTIYALEDDKTHTFLQKYQNPYKISKAYASDFYDKIIEPLSKHFEIDFSEAPSFNSETIELDFSKKQIFLSEEEKYLIIRPLVVYNDAPVNITERGNLLEKKDGKIIEFVRNLELEDEFIKFIVSLHPKFEAQKQDKIFVLHFEDFMKNMWFFNFFEAMRKTHVEVYGLKDLKNFKYSPHKATVSTSIGSGQDWFDVEVNVSFGNQDVRLQDIKKAIINKQKFILLKDGSVGILPTEWVHKLEQYFRNGEIKNDKLKVSKMRFSIVDELFKDIDQTEILEELAVKRERLEQFRSIEKVAVPKEIKADLRNYQKEGLNWLNFLNEMQWGGILADDMGLGKTLQILTFLQQIIKKEKTPNLIIVPTTLLFNWEKEIQKFAPKLNFLFHYGPERQKDTSVFKKHHIIFTTYGILLRDIELLKDYQFNYMILDESQAIKNPASRRYKAAILIKAKNKLALTGTPIENSTFDLFAQMNFVNSGMLGLITHFKTNYSNPIDKEGNAEIAQELQKIINPFVLRRTKEQVATELPPKIEDIIYCEMPEKQRKVYDAYRNEFRDAILNTIEEQGVDKSKFMILEALTRLRQICDSPALLKDDNIETQESIKIQEIVNHITEKTSNHKILIFSQFVGMLSLLREELDKLYISYEYLDGKSSTKQREASVNNFQTNESLRVFLISLKAGGTGLNLTAADYVYILDPWWNPAVENQAIDRCYRIGQDKHVFAYRMICKNTIEEKIMSLQAKKKKIATDIIQTDENIMKNIDMSDIQDFLS